VTNPVYLLPVHCSFCGLRYPDEVDDIVLGIGVAICPNCAFMCVEIIKEKAAAREIGFGEREPSQQK
jgi:ATP-dependent protease Clp ATPase subunit